MRRLHWSMVLTLGFGLAAPTAGASAEGAEGGEGETAPAEVTRVKPAGASSSGQASRRKRRRPRKAAKPRGHVVADANLRSRPLPRPTGNLNLVNIADKERIKINIYNDDGSFNTDAIDEVSHLLRCKRTDDERVIDPRLMVVLSHVYDHFHMPIEIVSGYRNQQKTTSFHFKGSASDIRISGVNTRTLRSYVESLDAGGMGVGYYPRGGFVHVDIRPAPSYRWIDNSGSDPDSADKRPPRGWKNKRRLRS